MRRHLTLHLCCSSLNAAEDCRPEMMHWQNTSSIPRRLTFCKYSGIFVILGDALGGLLQRNEACSMQPAQSDGFEAEQTGASAVQAQPAAPPPAFQPPGLGQLAGCSSSMVQGAATSHLVCCRGQLRQLAHGHAWLLLQHPVSTPHAAQTPACPLLRKLSATHQRLPNLC